MLFFSVDNHVFKEAVDWSTKAGEQPHSEIEVFIYDRASCRAFKKLKLSDQVLLRVFRRIGNLCWLEFLFL